MPKSKKAVYSLLYVVFLFMVCGICYIRPIQDDFDRYVYEALTRGRDQDTETIYRIVKHESPRAESSTVLDSPAHLAQLEPLYAIRPLYLRLVSAVALKLSPQQSINFVSAFSLFWIGILSYAFTRSYLYSALLLATPGVMVLGRLGGPDALSSLTIVAGCVAILRNRLLAGIALLMLSVWVRTDNVLLVLAMLGWLLWSRRIAPQYALVLAALAVGSVEYINFFSGNYGWKVLLHYSFVGGKYPAEIKTGITLSQYLHTFVSNAESLMPQLAPFLLLGLAAWRLDSSPDRRVLVPVLFAGVARYLLFPSGEARYFGWACLITGLVFIRSVQGRASAFLIQNRAKAIAA